MYAYVNINEECCVALCFRYRHSCHAVCNRIIVFVAAQLRKAPPKKPEGEIKPYSLMEREGEYDIKHADVVKCDSFIAIIHSYSICVLSCSGSWYFQLLICLY